jgi:ribonuclease M5
LKPILYVVEGRHDSAKLKLIDPKIETWITNGSHFKEARIKQLIELSNKYELVLLLDPDGAGERIRKRIVSYLPNVKQIFVPQNLAYSPQGKIGIEHMDVEVLKGYLTHTKQKNVSRETWTAQDLYVLGLAGSRNAQELRKKLSVDLGLPYANVKSFCRQLNQFGVDKETVMKKVNDES